MICGQSHEQADSTQDRSSTTATITAVQAPDRSRIETTFDVPFVADLALREKQIQQNYRPVIAVHKWFARRPGTLFRSLILSEFTNGPLRQTYYMSHDLPQVHIADPFMGGGTPLLEANRLGCSVAGYDINPMAYWVVRQEIASLDLGGYREAASRVQESVRDEIGALYSTTCTLCGAAVPVKYFLWVKVIGCSVCGGDIDLFPGYLLAENQRHPKNVLICPSCGELSEVDDRHHPGSCHSCGTLLQVSGPASRNRCACPHCGAVNSYPNPLDGPPSHRMIAIEYHCPHCKPKHVGRFFKRPDPSDLSKYVQAEHFWAKTTSRFVPDEAIPRGDETDRLHRWGYRHYREMFNGRQLLGLELLCRAVVSESSEVVRDALATNVSDLLRYQNMLCRYDPRALKSLDIFSVHGFPVGLIQCESNLFGIVNGEGNVGSGGWSNIVEKYSRAKQYCSEPFEVRHEKGQKIRVPISGEWIGERHGISPSAVHRSVEITCGDATTAEWDDASVDAVLTDPPYFANVQYAELMDFCFVWLRRLVSDDSGVFRRHSTRSPRELTGNVTMDRGLSHFTHGLAETFRRTARALKPGAPFVFTYHHNVIDAYFPIAVAMLDAGLVCSASLPCPGEMGGSIHINGTGSSIIDTVFVCRSTGIVNRRTIVTTPNEIAGLVLRDSAQLSRAGIRCTSGDLRCIAYGHLIRLAVWHARINWDREAPVKNKMERVAQAIEDLGGFKAVEKQLPIDPARHQEILPLLLKEDEGHYDVPSDMLPF